jgi:hypothetical protein
MKSTTVIVISSATIGYICGVMLEADLSYEDTLIAMIGLASLCLLLSIQLLKKW